MFREDEQVWRDYVGGGHALNERRSKVARISPSASQPGTIKMTTIMPTPPVYRNTQLPTPNSTHHRKPPPHLQAVSRPTELVIDAAVHKAQRISAEKYDNLLRSFVTAVSRLCPICIVLSDNLHMKHSERKAFLGCRRESGVIKGVCNFQLRWMDWKRAIVNIQQDDHNIQSCIFCGLPISVVTGGHDIESGQGCQYADILHLVAWVVFHKKEWYNRLQDELGCPVEDDIADDNTYHTQPHLEKQYGLWLAELSTTPRHHYTRIMEVFIWFCVNKHIDI